MRQKFTKFSETLRFELPSLRVQAKHHVFSKYSLVFSHLSLYGHIPYGCYLTIVTEKKKLQGINEGMAILLQRRFHVSLSKIKRHKTAVA